MILTSYKVRGENGEFVEFNLTPVIKDAEILVSSSKYEGICIQVLHENPKAISQLLPQWVHDEFYLFPSDGQLMIRTATK